MPANEPAWQLLNDLKDIVDLAVSPSHTKASIAYLAFKISEHRIRFQEVFPETKLLPKHHYLEHYPELIEIFGPLVALWTMRFEAKHSFFKRVVHHTNCFKNVLLSLSQRHQFHMAYHLYQCSSLTPRLEVSHVSNLPIDVLNEDISRTVQQKHPNLDVVCLAKEVTSTEKVSSLLMENVKDLQSLVKLCKLLCCRTNHCSLSEDLMHGILNIIEPMSWSSPLTRKLNF